MENGVSLKFDIVEVQIWNTSVLLSSKLFFWKGFGYDLQGDSNGSLVLSLSLQNSEICNLWRTTEANT